MDTNQTSEMVEFFQSGGPDEALKACADEWLAKNPGRRIVSATFEYASAGDRHGRWVGIKIIHELDRSYSHAD